MGDWRRNSTSSCTPLLRRAMLEACRAICQALYPEQDRGATRRCWIPGTAACDDRQANRPGRCYAAVHFEDFASPYQLIFQPRRRRPLSMPGMTPVHFLDNYRRAQAGSCQQRHAADEYVRDERASGRDDGARVLWCPFACPRLVNR